VAGSPYAIVPSAAVGAGLTNYAIVYDTGSLTVNQAALTITAKSTNKLAGEAWTFAGTEFSASGLQNSETVGLVTLTSAGAPASAAAGTYTIVPSAPTGGTFAQENYTDAFVDGTLTVSGLPSLTLTVNGNQYVLAFPTQSGQAYQLQYKTNLAIAGWAALGEPITGTGAIVSVTNLITAPQAFFRLQIGQIAHLTPSSLTLSVNGNQYVLAFPTQSGQAYQLQYKTNLAIAGWTPLGGWIPGTGATVNVTNTIAAPQAFFRLQIAP
jgi:hypothetical protein